MDDLEWQRLNQIEAEWESIENSYRIAPYQSPLNLREEKGKLFDACQLGGAYNPRFEFAQHPEYPTKQIRHFIASLEP